MMMGVALLFLVFFAVVCIIVLPSMFLFFYFKSFKYRAIILQEVGDDENDALIHIVNCKVVNTPDVGEVIKFKPGSGVEDCKRFGSENWTSLMEKRNLRQGIILYKQGKNLRPVRLQRDKNDNYFLDVIEEDNRKFMMQSMIMKNRKLEDYRVVRTAVLSFFIFLGFYGIATLMFWLAVMDQNGQVIAAQHAMNLVSQ